MNPTEPLEPKAFSVGIIRESYPEQRNISYASSFDVSHQLMHDRLEILKKLYHRLTGVGYSSRLQCFAAPRKPFTAPVIHSFNAIVLGKTPWIVTYETTLPRTRDLPELLIRYALHRLASKQCIGAISLSLCAHERLLDDIRSNQPEISEIAIRAITSKMVVLHPPQRVLIESDALAKKQSTGTLRLAIVGHDFYRKGGLEVLLAMDALVREGKDIEISIAGKMTAGDYASRAGEHEIAMANDLIQRLGPRVRKLGSIPAEEVLSVLRESHVLCLPTWGDTYGYSVLEGQGAGCATITTDLRALPEINNDACGWVIKVPKLPNGDGDLDSAEKRVRFREILVAGLKNTIREAHDDREGLHRRAVSALDRIRAHHDPASHAERLKQIYALAK